MSKSMTGYKIFGPDYTCDNYKFSLDSINVYDGNIKKDCEFRVCPRALDCLRYRKYAPYNTFAEVEGDGEYVQHPNSITCRKLKIVRTLTYEEFGELLTGNIVSERRLRVNANYVGGKLNGKYIKFNEDRNVEIETNYMDDVIHGVYREWHQNGRLFIHTNYVNGKIHGSYREWNMNGKLVIKCSYVNDQRHGSYTEWDSWRGEIIRVKTYYKYGRLHGNYKSWNEDGTLVEDCDYKYGLVHIPRYKVSCAIM